jgi:predicted peptidase
MTKPLVYKNNQSETLPYRIYLPPEMPLTPIPVVMFYHGAGERGDNNIAQVKHAVREIITWSINNEPMIIIAPQCPNNKKWAEVDWSKKTHTMPKKISFAMRLSLEILEKICKDYPVDQRRLYVTGLSMGGYGTWDIIQRFPKKFAAAMPVCGGGDVAGAPLFKDLPIWVFHGDKDGAVPVSRSRDMVKALQKCGSQVKYTEYPGVGHGCWAQTYANQNVLKWFFSQKR